MVTRKLQRVRLELTEEQQATFDEVRQKLEAEEKSEIVALARRLRQAKRRGRQAIQETLRVLKLEREAQGISLSAMEERSGMAKSNLSKLENAVDSDPTVATLMNYADALGKRLVITLVDK